MNPMKNALSLLFAMLFAAQCFAQAIVDPALSRSLAKRGSAEVLAIMTTQTDLSPADALATKTEKGQWVFERLTTNAATSQASLVAWLRANHLEHQSFWVVNAVRITGITASQLAELSRRSDIARLENDGRLVVEQPAADESNAITRNTMRFSGVPTNEWGIDKIHADQVWALGYLGNGIVVAGEDTGISWEEPAIKSKYRGWNGTTVEHSYNWHDAIHMLDTNHNVTTPNPCGLNIIAPCDDHGHGTHTVGTMIGDTIQNTRIGVAPNARWIGCRNMERGNGMPSTYIECFQWFIAPTDLNGANPMPSKAPHVINNSWGCPPDEGCNPSNFATMNAVINAVRAAGIVPVVSAGNDGPGCSSVMNPASIFQNSFTVGATRDDDLIAGFSSRGPVAIDSSNRRKPDVAAPGVHILSCLPGGASAAWSGTSMAGPHVAGAVALLLSARPQLIGQVAAIELLLQQTAEPLFPATGEECGGDNATTRPNNTFGWGRINILAAVQQALATNNAISDDGTKVSCYPNPTTTETEFRVLGFTSDATFTLTNAAGQCVYTARIRTDAPYTLPTTALPSGVYFFSLTDGAHRANGKLVRQ